jgi:hypothetical protein
MPIVSLGGKDMDVNIQNPGSFVSTWPGLSMTLFPVPNPWGPSCTYMPISLQEYQPGNYLHSGMIRIRAQSHA